MQTLHMRELWSKGIFILTNCGVMYNAYRFKVGVATAIFAFTLNLRHLKLLPNKFFTVIQYMQPALYANFIVEMYHKHRMLVSHALITVTFCIPCIMCFYRKVDNIIYLGAVTLLLASYGFYLFPEIDESVLMCAVTYPLLGASK